MVPRDLSAPAPLLDGRGRGTRTEGFEMQTKRTPGVPRREAYTASVSPLVPVDRARTKPRTRPETWWCLTLLYAAGLVGFAAAGDGVAFFVLLVLGWLIRATFQD
jgi:hypothetical protein